MSTPNRKQILFAFFVLFVLGFILWSMLYQTGNVGGPEKTQPGQKARNAIAASNWTKAENRTMPSIYAAVGTVRSRDEVAVMTRLPAARIVDIKVRNGDRVKRGDVLVELENEDLLALVRSAEENLKRAESNYAFADGEFNRTKALYDKQAVPLQALDAAQNNLNTVHAEMSMSRHALENARANLAYATLRSPLDGIVSERLSDPGNIATPGAAILKVFDPDKLELRIPVREGLVSSIAVGETVPVRIGALAKTARAEIREIIPSVDPGSRTFQISAVLPGETAGIMPGMFAECAIPVGERKVIVIPGTAVRTVGQLEYAMVKGKDGDPIQQMVTTISLPDGESREIVSGIREGDYFAESYP